MNKSIAIATTLVVALAAFSFATADDTSAMNCKDVQTLADESDLALGDLYVTLAPSVWEESNGYAGLQTHDHTCRVKHDGAGRPLKCGGDNQPACDVRTIPADTQHA